MRNVIQIVCVVVVVVSLGSVASAVNIEPGPEEDAIEFGATWNYLHPLDAADPAGSDFDFNITWMQTISYDGPAFDNSGPAILGYGGIGMGGVKTNIGQPPSGSRYTAYFRREFVLDDPMVEMGIEIFSDDGAFAYIDGVEVVRNNISPTDSDTYTTSALGYKYPDGWYTEDTTKTFSIADLEAGTHTIGVSVHQSDQYSSDLGFDLRLFGRPVPEPATLGMLALGGLVVLRRRRGR